MYEIKQNRTALVIPIWQAEPSLQPFREKYISTPAAIMPPHITIYGPFIPMQYFAYPLLPTPYPSFGSTSGNLS